MINNFTKSNKLLAKAERSIPLGSQTFSKSKIAYPQGVSPLFVTRGQGCYLWDVDGNKYLDFVSGLLSVSLGYCDDDVDAAVKKQIDLGVTFSLPHELEVIVAEQLIDLIPCAEMVRFGKNGSDATSAAIRLARAYTNREHIAVCGYHGWQDWYIGSTTRDLGVPNGVKALTHKFNYNDIKSLEKIFHQQSTKVAAVILEPMNTVYPKDNFLQRVKQLCEQNQSVLIFDETITGFRYSNGGAQQFFGVTPDLATFGKGMGNGYPISAVVGKKEIMNLMEDIFFSGTFAGETLSLAATHATLNKIINQDVVKHLNLIGSYLIERLNQIVDKKDICNWVKVYGHPSWSFCTFLDTTSYSALELKSLFLQEMNKRGILLGGGHNLNFSHTIEDIDYLLNAYDQVFDILKVTIENNDFDDVFNGKLLEPVFKVR